MSQERVGDTHRLGRDQLDGVVLGAAPERPYATLLLDLTAARDRRAAGRALARALGAEDLVLFLRDPELGVLLPAPGFPQSLPHGRSWREFVERCAESASSRAANGEPMVDGGVRFHRGLLHTPGVDAPIEATGFASGRDTVLVLLDGAPDQAAVELVSPFLPLVVRALEGERVASVADAHARVARAAAARAEALAGSLDAARVALQRALDEVRESRARLQEQTTELQSANEELEAQAEELRSTTDELLRQMDVAAATANALRESQIEADRARRAAEEANRSKSEFLTMMSHELRTPLNAIGGYAELLDLGVRGPVTEEQHLDLERIMRSQRHLLGLINGVLNFAKVDAGALLYELTDVRLDEVLATCEALTVPQLRTKKLEFRYDDRAVSLVARADREKVQQSVLNLLSNAIKFTEPGGRVTLSCAADGEHAVVVRVTDTGRGIAADQIERIFQPFVQIDAKLTRTQEGTGLGLAISRNLARGMGGDLTVESELGVGSTFTLRLVRAT